MRAAKKEDAQLDLFGDPQLDRTKAIEFYEHEMDWVNRLILGDSVVAMTSLLERERLGGQVQMVYIDPPYGINFNSNFQARISERSPKETVDGTLTREPEQIQAYRDTWELGIHSYLTYLRERLVVARELLRDDGSVFVQIGPDNLHLVRNLLDEVFGPENSCTVITVAKTSQVTSKLVPEVADYLVWYARDKSQVKYRQLFEPRSQVDLGPYRYAESPDGERRKLSESELLDPRALINDGWRIFRFDNATSQGFSRTKTVDFEFRNQTYHPGKNRHWLLRPDGMKGLAEANRLEPVGNTLSYIRYLDDFGGVRRTNVWTDTVRAGFARKKQYVVETSAKIVERAIAMTTDAGDLVVDPTCGSGTTAWCCERLGRRWITIDTSRVALAIARERLLTAKFDYYHLRNETRGIDGGLEYETLTRVTASSIGYGTDPETEVLYDQPKLDRSKVRVSGPFTVEGLSRYATDPFSANGAEASTADAAAGHVSILLDALRTQGIPRQNGKPAEVISLTPLSGGEVLHAEGVFRDADGSEQPFAVSMRIRFRQVAHLQSADASARLPADDHGVPRAIRHRDRMPGVPGGLTLA